MAVGGPPVLGAGRDPDADRWYVRLRGADKDVLTVWLHLRQRTLAVEAQMMPAPETRRQEVFAYLLRRNGSLAGLRFALGPEDAVLVRSELAIGHVVDDELDRLVGGALAVVDDCFATAMAMGFEGRYRRRPSRHA